MAKNSHSNHMYVCRVCGNGIIVECPNKYRPSDEVMCTDPNCGNHAKREGGVIPSHVKAHFQLFKPEEITEQLIDAILNKENGYHQLEIEQWTSPAQKDYYGIVLADHVAMGGLLFCKKDLLRSIGIS